MTLTQDEITEIQSVKQELAKTEAYANAANPEGHASTAERIGPEAVKKHSAFEKEREAYKAKAETLRARYEELKSKATPEQSGVLESGAGRSQFEAESNAVSLWGGNITQQGQYHYSSNPVERADQETYATISKYYDYATNKSIKSFFVDKTIDETQLSKEDEINREKLFGYDVAAKEVKGFSRSAKEFNNTSIDYESTLAARQAGLNVLSGITRNLDPSFQRDEDRRFSERNKIISLTENINTGKESTQTKTNTAWFVGLTESAQGQKVNTHYTVELSEGAGTYKRVRNPNQDQIKKDHLANRANLTEFLKGAQKQGATRISIYDESGKLIKESPLERAFYEIFKASKNKQVNIVAGGDIVERITGYSQDISGKISITKIQEEKFKTGLAIPLNEIKENPDGTKTISKITPYSQSLKEDEAARRALPQDPLSKEIRKFEAMSKHSTNPIIQFGAGFNAEVLSGAAGLVNLSNLGFKAWSEKFVNGTQTNQTQIITSQPQDVSIAKTAPSDFIGAVVQGGSLFYETKNPKALSKIGEGISGYGQALYKSPARVIGESIGFVFPVGSGSLKAIPLRLEKTAIEGVSASARSLAVGYGLKTKQMISFTSEGKVMLGKPRFEAPITIEAVTAKQQLRGTKLAADSNQATQKTFTDLETIKQINGVTPEILERARNINKIIEIGSKSKDPVKRGFTDQPFESIKPQETPSLKKSFEGQQKRLTGRLGAIEGSTSQIPYLLENYIRKSGDFDFHLKTFQTARQRATQTAKEIIPFGQRSFEANINLEKKSAHVDLKENGKKSKVGEFLNEEEIDEEGTLQALTGDTIFSKKIPEGTDKIEGLKNYELQRQFVKKGESIFSIQKDDKGKLSLEPFAPRKNKDVSDFYAIGETKAVNLLLAGRTEEALELGRELSQFKKNFSEVDIHGFFEAKQAADKTIIPEGKSIIDKIGETDPNTISGGLLGGTKLSDIEDNIETEKPRHEFSAYTQNKIQEKSDSIISAARSNQSLNSLTSRPEIKSYSNTSMTSRIEQSVSSKPSLDSKSISSLGSKSPSSYGSSLSRG